MSKAAHRLLLQQWMSVKHATVHYSMLTAQECVHLQVCAQNGIEARTQGSMQKATNREVGYTHDVLATDSNTTIP